MYTRTLFAVVLFLALAVVCSGADVSPLTLYVSALDGDDRGPGDIQRPLKSMLEAQKRVRAAISGGMKSDAEIIIRAGEYAFSEPFKFDDRDSGRDGYKVVYKGYPGEMPIMTGGKRVIGWTAVDDHIYKADVGKDLDIHVVYENGEWAIPARHPNDGYLRAYSAANGEAAAVTLKPEDFPGNFGYADAYLGIWAGAHGDGWCYDWYESLSPITKVDSDTRTVNLEYTTFWNASANNRIYIAHARELLDAPGEYYYDRVSGTLYYYPRKTPVEDQAIIIPAMRRLVDIQSRSAYRPVENIVFDNIGFEYTDSTFTSSPKASNEWDGLIVLHKAKSITFRNCRIRNAGLSGIVFSQENENHLITGCLFEKIGAHCINSYGYFIGVGPHKDPAKEYISKNFIITNNYFRDCGKRVGHGSGIWIAHSGGHEISNNLFENMPRYAVNMIGWSYQMMIAPVTSGGQGGEIYGKKITWENHMDFIHTRNIKILNNEIRDVMKNSSDGGAVYSWGAGGNILVSGNLIYNVKAFTDNAICVGIYLDDAAKYFTLKNNIVTRIGGSNWTFPYLIKGVKNIVMNNIAADNQAEAAFFIIEAGMANRPDSEPGVQDERVGDLVFERNIIYKNGNSLIYKLYPWRTDLVAKSDNNLYFHPDSKYEVMIDWAAKPWTDWLQHGYEKNTLYADPLFNDPESMDYRLRGASPALKMGFKQIDQSNIGLKPGFPFMDEVKKSDTAYGRNSVDRQ